MNGPPPRPGHHREPRSRAQSGLDVQLELDPERGKAMEVAGFVGWLSTTAVLREAPPDLGHSTECAATQPRLAGLRACGFVGGRQGFGLVGLRAASATSAAPHLCRIPAPRLAVLYLFWALTPDAQLQAMGIHYYPNRYLAVAVPAWSIVTFLCWSLAVTGANLCATAPPESYESLQG